MKRIFFFFWCMSFCFLITDALAQCPDEITEDSIAAMLGKQGFVVVEKYNFNVKSKREMKEKSSYSYLFNKGTTYLIYVINPHDHKDGDFVVSVFDKNDFYVAGTYSEGIDKYYDKLSFNCKTTGNYIIQCFLNKRKYCGKILVAMKKKTVATIKQKTAPKTNKK